MEKEYFIIIIVIYIGDWKNDITKGKGKLFYVNGDIYDGDWKNNKIEGGGSYYWIDGRIYNGD